MFTRPLLLLLVFSTASFAQAEPHSLARYVNDDTLLVARTEVALLRQAMEFEQWLPGFGETLNERDKRVFGQFRGALQAMQGFGIDRAELIVAIPDIRPQVGPLLIFSLNKGVDSLTTATAMRKVLSQIELDFPYTVMVAAEGQRLLLGSQDSLDRYQTLAATPRPDLLEAFDGTEKTAPAFVGAFSPGKESRRVIRELWPTLHEPFAKLTGPLLADRLQHVVLTLEAESHPQVELLLSATDEFSSERLMSIVANGLDYLADRMGTQKPPLAPLAQEVAQLLAPTRTGTQVTLSFAPQEDHFQQILNKALMPAVADARERAKRHQLMNQVKQIALAFHNFHDTQGFFPAPATFCDAGGKPLLSWRVAILPYLERSDLFDRFHLDEPWDSPHNLKLAEEMPDIYVDAMSPELAPQGRTTFLQPIYPGGPADPSAPVDNPLERFRQKQKYYLVPGLQFKNYTDGTSKTILFAQVAPEFAQPWTKPADWRVDLENPAAELQTNARKKFVTGWADGHGGWRDLTIGPAYLRAIITHAEGVPVPEE